MAQDWLIEQRDSEVWAWAREDCLFLRLGRSGTGTIFDLDVEKSVGDFRWRTPSCPSDFEQMQPHMWVELLEAQLADPTSDLVLARNFHLTPPHERVWQLLDFERGTRDSFCDCIRLVFMQENVLRSLIEQKAANHLDKYLLHFRLESERNICWNSNLRWFSSGGLHFPELQAKMYRILDFFGPRRNAELVRQRRASSDFQPALRELAYPLKFSVSFEPNSFSAHENLELFLRVRALFEEFLSPAESARLLEQLGSR